jgi:hypothetical protein
MAMKLVIERIISNREIMHYADPNRYISSFHNRVYVGDGSREREIVLPDRAWRNLLGHSRLGRRALRLDKCNVVPVGDNLVIVRQGQVYRYDVASKQLSPTLGLRQCRCVLHQSIAVVGSSSVFFGEYGRNTNRAPVPIYRSRDGGITWQVAYEFDAGQIKHVHGCYWDPYEQKIWVLTGDFEKECHILVTDETFDEIEWIGNGSQIYRACSVFFEKDAVHWMMDSQLEFSHHIRFDRKTRQVSRLGDFPGPVWYIKRLADGYYLAATAQEIGPGVRDEFVHVMVSKDLETWQTAFQFKHDGLPKRYFKFGVIGFADGLQSSDRFYLFGEAIKGLDGKIARCRLET